ncbi:MAG: recombinase family protein [Acidimicrobiales bacterium]|jgi:DNA invertase Pin-like site-specific DNA recombinase
MRVGLYTRISEDIAGEGLGVARQEQDCRALAERRGWTVAGIYEDNDVSAFKTRVKRPEFERLMEDLERGLLDGLVVYDLDRFARQPLDLERSIRIFDSRNLVFATVQSDINLSTSDGRTMARVMVAFANKSSMDTARRVRRKHLELAQTGVPTGGWRPFGYLPDRRTLDVGEAQLIRRAAADVIGGVGLHTICRHWNEEGVLTTAGNIWRKTVLKSMLVSPRIAGYRVYRGGIARDEAGNPVRGLIEPILDLETWEKVKAVLQDPERSSKHSHLGGRKYLLSGIVRCGACGKRLNGNAVRASVTVFAYSCKVPTSGGCGKVAVTGPRVDALVTALVLEYLADRHVDSEAQPWKGQAELAAVTDRVDELMRAFTAGELSSDVVFPAVSTLETQARELREARLAWTREQVALTSRPADVVGAWPTLDLDQQRAVIASVFHSVVVKPSGNRGPVFDPSRVEVVWR